MLGRVIAAVVFTLAVSAAAAALDVKLPEIDFRRYHALVIGNKDYEHLPKLSNARLTNYLKAMSAHHVMVVTDSC